MEQTQRQPQTPERLKTSGAPSGACEFTTTQEHLIHALRALAGVAGRNPALPILSHVLLKREQNQLRLSSTDLEVGITAWLPGKLQGDGAITVPLRPFAEYVQNLPGGPLTLSLRSGALRISTERDHATFQGETAENFPLIPQLAEGTDIPLLIEETRRALDAVLYAVAIDDTRPELSGVFLRGGGSTLTIAATDSYRLAEARFSLLSPIAAPLSVILPSRSAQEVRRALDEAETATLCVGENQVLLRTPTLHVISRRVEGIYPEYTHIIPQKQPTSVEVDRASLLRATRASAVFSGNTVSRVTLEAGAGTLRVSATTPEMGETETRLPADVVGESVTIAFNERFLRDALSVLTGTRVRIGLGTSATPALFQSVGEEKKGKKGPPGDPVSVLALVMPIKT